LSGSIFETSPYSLPSPSYSIETVLSFAGHWSGVTAGLEIKVWGEEKVGVTLPGAKP